MKRLISLSLVLALSLSILLWTAASLRAAVSKDIVFKLDESFSLAMGETAHGPNGITLSHSGSSAAEDHVPTSVQLLFDSDQRPVWATSRNRQPAEPFAVGLWNGYVVRVQRIDLDSRAWLTVSKLTPPEVKAGEPFVLRPFDFVRWQGLVVTLDAVLKTEHGHRVELKLTDVKGVDQWTPFETTGEAPQSILWSDFSIDLEAFVHETGHGDAVRLRFAKTAELVRGVTLGKPLPLQRGERARTTDGLTVTHRGTEFRVGVLVRARNKEDTGGTCEGAVVLHVEYKDQQGDLRLLLDKNAPAVPWGRWNFSLVGGSAQDPIKIERR